MPFTLTFLAAADGTKLTKDTDKNISYPLVYNFTSSSYSIENLEQFTDILEHKASEYACLLKGEILGSIKNSSRAGTTSPYTKTEWICLDIDGLDIKHEDELISKIPELANKSYIKQYSASQGVKPGLRTHLIYLLDNQVDPSALKLWLTKINLDVLSNEVVLNKAHTALKYPLDITVCQNDKLIYIAPPISSKPDPIKTRIELIEHADERVTLDLSTLQPEVIKAAAEKHKTKLRKALGLSTRKDKFEADILLNPPEAQVTGSKVDRGFVYLNLNGGNSWGYYFPIDNPEIVYNFKSEPNAYLKDLAPEFYAEYIQKNLTAGPGPSTQKKGKYYLAFNDKITDQYHVGYYDYDTETSDIYPVKNKSKVNDFLKEHGQPSQDYIPTWNYVTDFSSDVEFDPSKKFINRFIRSDYLKNPVKSDVIPPLTLKLLEHTFGEATDHFINWAALIIQKRTRTLTAWVLGGVQGSGKGSITELLLMPLLGKSYVKVLNIANLESDFNSFADNTLLITVDEAQVSNSKQIGKIMNRVKHLITEKHITINKKFCPEYTIENHMNFMFTGNQYDITQIDPDDRRYNVPDRQETKLLEIMTKTQIEKGIKKELHEFAGYLLGYPASAKRAGEVKETTEKLRIQQLTRDSNQQIVDNLKSGNLQFFYDNRPEHEDPIQFELATRIQQCITYDEMLVSFLEGVGDGSVNIPNDHLRLIFYYIGDQHFKTAHKFTKFLNHKGMNPKAVSYRGKSTRGLYGIKFIADDLLIQAIKLLDKKTASKVINING